ncbi:Sister chromatid cohesion protein pds5 [Coemansia sp. RSA 2603]|nr:Sister chromatid cohesion protein pds5 [Coemansia sp. RSA 2603]
MMLRKLTVDISARFPEKAKMESALTQMAGLRDSEVYKGLRATMNAENDIKAVRKYQKSALKKLASLAPNILDTTAPLWKCVGLTTINRVLVPFLIQYVSSSSSSSLALGRSMDESQTDLGGTSGLLLEYITRVFPEMLQSYKIELFDVAELRSDAVVAVEDRLALLVKFAKAIPGGVPRSDELENQLASFVRSGVSVRQAKYAAYLITQIEGSEALCAVLVGDTVDNLDNAHIEKRAPAFAALSRFAQYAPAAFATYAERTSAFLIQTVLMGKFGVQDDDADNMDDGDDDGSSSDEWVERSRLDDAALSKVYAVKILTNWLVGMDLQSVTRDRAQSVVGTLRQLVRGSGEMQQEGKTAPGTKQHLQLTAASCMLKVSSVKQFRDLLSAADIESLALVVQNPCFEVRSAFLLDKLLPMLVGWRLHVRFIPVVFLVAHDPEASLRDNVRHVVQLRLSQIRPSPGSPSVVEDSLVRLLYMLAFHPDWDDSRMVETLELFARYIEFYITCVCSSQNVSLLFCYAGEIKAYRARADAVSRVGQTADMYTRRLYVVSELAQYLLREKSASANWPVNVYPGKLVLPSDIFVAVEAQEARGGAQAYLDAEFIQRRAKAPAGSRTGGAAAAASKRGRARAPSSAAVKRAKGTVAGKQAVKGKGEDGSDAEDVEMSSGDDDDDND